MESHTVGVGSLSHLHLVSIVFFMFLISQGAGYLKILQFHHYGFTSRLTLNQHQNKSLVKMYFLVQVNTDMFFFFFFLNLNAKVPVGNFDTYKLCLSENSLLGDISDFLPHGKNNVYFINTYQTQMYCPCYFFFFFFFTKICPCTA